jgi:hypothetical protein
MQVATAAVFALVLLLAAPSAQAASAREVLEKYGLIGTFSRDCSQPVSQRNSYIVHRPLDAERVQRDFMREASKSTATVIASASELRPNEIMIRIVFGERHTDVVYRVEGQRFRTLQSTRDNGEKIVVDGRAIEDGLPMPWLNKCG